MDLYLPLELKVVRVPDLDDLIPTTSENSFCCGIIMDVIDAYMSLNNLELLELSPFELVDFEVI